MPKKPPPKSWIVVPLSLSDAFGLTAEESMIEVVDKANALKVAKLITFFGSEAHLYPKGYYPTFDESGNLS